MRRLLALALLLAALPTTALAAYPDSFGPVADNPADALGDLPIEQFTYDRATHCVKKPPRGALALQSWLEANVRGVSWGIMRCEIWSRPPAKSSASLHAEGRAVDWHLDAHDKADAKAARRLIGLLLAPDDQGRPAALARRMGVQEIIWDCRSWFGGGWGDEQRLERYSPCYGRKGRPVKIDDTTAHRDHVHLGLTRRGAKTLTSFWTRTAPPASVAESAPGA
jgi:hypothetical protein